ncbi:MAG TPA: hypothetical protein PKG77_22575 [Phycisphaerae bacterium]|nr:hypothetical protein [Phycisphaerae bacterium]HQL73936.1 hypothetical protein [Phycisphaerae bacterium]
MAEQCGVCGQPVKDRRNRYCPDCTKIVRREMEQSGYLQRTKVRTCYGDLREQEDCAPVLEDEFDGQGEEYDE